MKLLYFPVTCVRLSVRRKLVYLPVSGMYAARITELGLTAYANSKRCIIEIN